MGCRFPKMFSFLPEKLVNLWNLCKFLHFGFSFYAQIALKQRIDSKHCLSSAGITRKSFFLSKNCPISAPLKVDCSGLSGRQLKKGVNFWFLLEMNSVEWQGRPMEYLGRCVITDKKCHSGSLHCKLKSFGYPITNWKPVQVLFVCFK